MREYFYIWHGGFGHKLRTSLDKATRTPWRKFEKEIKMFFIQIAWGNVMHVSCLLVYCNYIKETYLMCCIWRFSCFLHLPSCVDSATVRTCKLAYVMKFWRKLCFPERARQKNIRVQVHTCLFFFPEWWWQWPQLHCVLAATNFLLTLYYSCIF